MSKNTGAWMPLYVGDYLGDTQRLTTEQHGAYLLLILDYWRNGPAPDDDAVLQQITKLDRATWKRHRPALARLFQIADGEWRHKRIDRELEAAAVNSDRRSSKARAAAQARWGDATSNARSDATSIPGALLEECPPPSPSPEPIGSSSRAKALSPREAFPRPEFADPQHWRDFLENRKRKKRSNTATAHKRLLEDVARFADDEWPPGRLIEHAAAEGWAGIYDPRDSEHRNGHSTERRLDAKPNLRGPRPDPAFDLLNRARAEEAAEGAGCDPAGGGEHRPALPAYLAN